MKGIVAAPRIGLALPVPIGAYEPIVAAARVPNGRSPAAPTLSFGQAARSASLGELPAMGTGSSGAISLERLTLALLTLDPP